MNKLSNTKKSDCIIELILGVIICSVGGIVFISKISGARYGGTIEGDYAQLIGAVLFLYGSYKIIFAIRKIILMKDEKSDI